MYKTVQLHGAIFAVLVASFFANTIPTIAKAANDTERLTQLTNTILNPTHASTALEDEIVELTRILHRNGTVRFESSDDLAEGETFTNEGRALSPAMAAACAADSVRTVAFIRGLHAAIVDARKASPDRPVRILYVGSGPYALLATPQMTVFSPAEATFTVLDIHEPSVKSAESVISGLNLSSSVASYEVMDAFDYQVSPEQPPDVIVMEIMTAALESEPQVAITRHLMDQKHKAILVPESITVDAYLVDVAKEFTNPPRKGFPRGEDQRIHLGTVFEVSTLSVSSWKKAGSDRLPAASIQMPDSIAPGLEPLLYTTVRTYGENVLNEYESGLTMPKALSDTGSIGAGDTLNMYYRLGSYPGLAVAPLAKQEE
jgi:hypothetical protein